MRIFIIECFSTDGRVCGFSRAGLSSYSKGCNVSSGSKYAGKQLPMKCTSNGLSVFSVCVKRDFMSLFERERNGFLNNFFVTKKTRPNMSCSVTETVLSHEIRNFNGSWANHKNGYSLKTCVWTGMKMPTIFLLVNSPRSVISLFVLLTKDILLGKKTSRFFPSAQILKYGIFIFSVTVLRSGGEKVKRR